LKTRLAIPLVLGLITGACASSNSGSQDASGAGGSSASGGHGGTGNGGTAGSNAGGTTGGGGAAASGGSGGPSSGSGGAAGGNAGSTGTGGSGAGTGGKGGAAGNAGGAAGGAGGAAGGAAGHGGAGGSATAGASGGGGKAAGGTTGAGGSAGSGNSAGVHAVGTQLYDGSTPIRLMGVNRPGGEYSCVTGSVWDPADGSGNNAATITAMLAWKVNAVRIPLNEDCWLSLNSTKTAGAAYQSAILTWVNLLLQNNIYPILDLHWTENNGAQATGQQPMPDAAHAPAFWSSVAAAYAGSPKVIFDLFNEPYPDNNTDGGWGCWRDGGTCTGMSYPAAGMQSLVSAVRAAGANNLIVLGGIEYSNDLTQWLTYEPTDPANNLAASWHVYPNSNYTGGHTLMMDAMGVAGVVPIVATEIGDANCTAGGTDNGSFITAAMTYLDGLSPPQSYLAWSWSTDDQPILISSYNGTATCEGTTYMAHLLATPH
jgi:endoglucanase